MNKKFIRRIATIATSAALCAGAVCMFAGCTSNTPEVTIVYSFMNKTYDVKYVLSREDAPETVQHFIELADAGYYDGTCIHNYDANFLYGGGYFINESNELEEKDYFAAVKQLEAEGHSFTQTVYKTDRTTPLYTVVGEFAANNRGPKGRKNVHSRGALVMYYNDTGDYNVTFNYSVSVERADGGAANDGDKFDTKEYRYNSATSLFYTFLGDSRTDLDAKYAVIGKLADYSGDMVPLLDAIAEYTESLGEDESFTTSSSEFTPPLSLFALDHPDDPEFEALRRSSPEAEYNVPLKQPITVVTVRVDKR